MQKSDKIEQNPNETEGGLHLIQKRAHSKHFTKTGYNYPISGFQNNLQTKSDLHISTRQSQFETYTLP